jgi:hypothetical protein
MYFILSKGRVLQLRYGIYLGSTNCSVTSSQSCVSAGAGAGVSAGAGAGLGLIGFNTMGFTAVKGVKDPNLGARFVLIGFGLSLADIYNI